MGEISPARYRAGAGEPLVLLHGLTGTWRLWQPVLPELAARFDVLVPTLPGHFGGPPMRSPGPFSLDDIAAAIEDELTAQGIATAHLVGSSLGGAVALELAKRGRARSVIGFAPGFDWLPGDAEQRRLARHLRRQQQRTRASEARLDSVMRWAVLRRWALSRSMCHGERVSPSAAADMARASIRCTIAESVLEAIGAGAAGLDGLDRIAVPTLIAWPQRDRLTPRSKHGARFEREIPGVTMRLLPGVGHLPMYDDPALVASTIIEWVAGC
jgi:pimeloyl-ACP methyl ester carboxylesterase